MRRDKTAARILLILSVVHVAVAAPAIVRLRSLDIVKYVIPGLEKRGNSGDGSLYPLPQVGNDLPATSGTPPSQDDVQPPASGFPPPYNDRASTSRTPPLQDDLLPESETLPLHNEHPPTLGVPSLQDDTSSTSGDLELPNGPPARPEDPQLHDDPSQLQHINWHPPDEMLQDESSGVPQLHDDPLSQHTGESSRTPSTASGSTQLHDDPIWQWIQDFHANVGATSSSDVNSEVLMPLEPPPPPAPEAHALLNDAPKQTLKTYASYGLVAGVSAGLTLAVQKLINLKGNSHEAYVSDFFPPSPIDIQPSCNHSDL